MPTKGVSAYVNKLLKVLLKKNQIGVISIFKINKYFPSQMPQNKVVNTKYLYMHLESLILFFVMSYFI